MIGAPSSNYNFGGVEGQRKRAKAGFKILLDILAVNQRPPRVAEVPYQFGKRLYGASKLAVGVELEYLCLLLDKVLGR